VKAFILGPLLRLVPVGMVMLAVQRTVLAEARPFGVVLQVVLALAAATGAGAGSERGAIAGFTLGLMYDLATGSPLGLTALVYALAGYVAGYSLSLTPTPPWWLTTLFTGIGAAVGEVSVPIGLMLVGDDGWFTTRLFTIVPVVAAFAMILSPVFVPLGRWCMRYRPPRWRARPDETR
jgi:rod shape-determining protein MreD